jgi:hypothetical protein
MIFKVIFSDSKYFLFTKEQIEQIPYFIANIEFNTNTENNLYEFQILHSSAGFEYLHTHITMKNVRLSIPDNYVNLPRSRLLKILDRTRYTIASDENFFSLFTLDSLASGLFVFYNQQRFFNNYNINNFIPLKFSDHNYSMNKIINFTKKELSSSNKLAENFFYEQNYKIRKRLKLISRNIL